MQCTPLLISTCVLARSIFVLEKNYNAKKLDKSFSVTATSVITASTSCFSKKKSFYIECIIILVSVVPHYNGRSVSKQDNQISSLTHYTFSIK